MSSAAGSRVVSSRGDRARVWLSSRANLLFLAVLVIVIAVHVVAFFASMVVSPIGYDEAFNLQAPLNLVHGNGYATEDWENGGDRILFGAIVSTGPAVEIPVAAMFAIFGPTIEAARIVMLPFLGLLLACLFILGRRVAGRWGGLVAMFAVLALNTRADWPFTVIYGSSDALGEYAAAALLTLALVLLPRYRAWAGLAVGFAALAKFIAFMAAPALLIALLIIPVAGAVVARRQRIREIVFFLLLVVLPSVGWELVKLVSLGFSGYGNSLIDYIRFVFRSGSGVDGSVRAFVVDRFSRLFAAWHIPTTFAFALALVLFAMAVVGLSRYWRTAHPELGWKRGSRWTAIGTAIRSLPIDILAAGGTLAVFALWWTFIASSIFIRHTMPVLLATVPLISVLAVRGAVWLIRNRGVAWRRVAIGFIAGLAVVTVFQATLTVASSFKPIEWTRAQQVDAADFIKGLGVDQVQGLGWWASPELRFLSQVPSAPVGTGTGPLVLEPILMRLDPTTYQAGLDLCVDVLYDKNGYVVCSVSPDQKPVRLGVG